MEIKERLKLARSGEGMIEEALAGINFPGAERGAPRLESARRSILSEGLHRRSFRETNAAAVIPQGEHDAAVAAAEEKGRKAGAEGEGARLGAVLSAAGIKGDGKRMAAAVDLAMKSPAMSVEDVTAFVTSNVAAATEGSGSSTAEHEAGRMSGAYLAGPAGAAPEKSGLSKSIDAGIARNKRPGTDFADLLAVILHKPN